MKVLANETKRILAVLLSVAMIFAYVPNNVAAYADEIEDAETAEEINGTGEGETINPELEAAEDLDVWFADPDGMPASQAVNLYDFTTVDNAGGTTHTTVAPFDSTDHVDKTDASSAAGHRESVDHVKDYSFIVEPKTAAKIKDTSKVVKNLTFKKYTNAGNNVTTITLDSGWSVESYDRDFVYNGSVKVTIPASILTTVYDGGYEVPESTAVLGRQVAVNFVDDLTETATLSVPIKCYDNTVELDDVSEAQFIKEIDKDAKISLSDNVVHFKDYKPLEGNFVSVKVKNKKGEVVDSYTKSDKGSAAGNIVSINSVPDGNDDYQSLCDASGEFNVTELTGTSGLDSKRWVAYAVKSAVSDNSVPGSEMLYEGNLILSAKALQVIYSAGYSVEINVSAKNQAAEGDYGVIYSDDTENGFVTYKNNDWTDDAPINVAAGQNLVFTVSPNKAQSATRQIDRVWYTVGDNDEKATDDPSDTITPTPFESNGAKTYTIPTINGDTIIRTDASEGILVGGDGKAKATVISTAGATLPEDDYQTTAAQRAVDGVPYKFIVIADDGAMVKEVQASIGGGIKKTLSSNNGIYTTDIINKRLDIYVDTKSTAGGIHNVGLTEAASGVKVTPFGRTDAITTDNNQEFVEDGKPFYFVVTDTAGTGKINSVYVSVGTGNPYEVEPIAVDKANHKNYYVVGADETGVKGDVAITINHSPVGQLRTIHAINNDRATFDFAKPGKTTKAGNGTKFKFSVAPAASNVKITNVGWFVGASNAGTLAGYTSAKTTSISANKLHELGTTAGSYNFDVPAAAVTGDITVYALTEEAVPEEDEDGDPVFRFNFVDASADRVVSTYDPADKKDIGHLKSQNLKMVLTNTTASSLRGTEVYLYDKTNQKFDGTKFTYDTTSGNSAGRRNGSLTFEEKTTTKAVLINSDATATDKKTAKYMITPHDTGETVLNAKFAVDDAEVDGASKLIRGELNRLVFSEELPVSVTALYSGLYLDASTNVVYPYKVANYSSDMEATIEVRGKDGQTGKDVQVTIDDTDIADITWVLFTDPEKPEEYGKLPASSRNYGLGSSYAAKLSGRNYAFVRAKEPSSDPIQVQATVTYSDGTEVVLNPIPIRSVKKPDYPFFFVTKTSGAYSDDNYAIGKDYGDTEVGNILLGLAENDSKKLNIDYDVYQVLDEINWNALADDVGFVTGGTTKETLDKGVDKGFIKKINYAKFSEMGVSMRNQNLSFNDDEDPSDYIELSGENGSYTVTPKKATPTTGGNNTFVKLIAPEITIDGVTVASLNPEQDYYDYDSPGWVYREDQVQVRVLDRQVKNKVNLVLYDSVRTDPAKPETTVITETKLKDSYIASRPNSELKSQTAANKNAGEYTYGKSTGIQFDSIAKGSTFVLPTADDFATSPSSNRILIGWQEYTGTNGGINDGVGDTVSSNYCEAGEAVPVNGAVTFRAVWEDRYGIEALTNGNMVSFGQDDYDETITDAKKYDTELGDIYVDGVIPVVLKVTEAYSIDKTNNTTTPKIKGKSKYITTGFTLTNKNADTADAIKIGMDDNNRPTIKGVKKVDAKPVVVKASWDSGNGTITKESAEFRVLEAKAFDITLNQTAISVQEGQDPETAVATTGKVKIGTTEYISLSETNTAENYAGNFTFTWSNAKEADAEYATAQTKYDKERPDSIETENKDWKLTNFVSGLKKTSEPVELTLTAANKYGQTVTKTLKVTVNSPKVSIKLYKNDKAKTEITDGKFEAFAKKSHLDVDEDDELIGPTEQNSFLVKAFDESDKDITSSTVWAIDVPLDPVNHTNKVIDHNWQLETLSNIADGSGYQVAQLDTYNTVDEDKLTVKYTYDGVTYCKDVLVSTCFAIQLVGEPAVDDNLKKNTYITENGTKIVDEDGDPADAFIRVGLDKKVKAEEGSGFSFNTISLAGYSAVYENKDTNPDTRTFDHWVYPTYGTERYAYTTEIASLNKTDFEDGIYAIRPEMTGDITLTGIPATITLGHDMPGVVNTSQKFDIEVEPASFNGTNVYAKSDKVGFFASNGLYSSGIYQSSVLNVNKLKTKKEGNFTFSKAGNNKDTWKAGKANLEFFASPTSTKVLATATLYVNGLDMNDETGKRSYYENGEKVTSTMRTVYDNSTTGVSKTYYFDEKGDQITDAGVYTIDGKKVLLGAQGAVAPKGVQTFQGKEYLVEGDNGELAVAKLVDANGVQRYANSDGVLVTYEMADANGKYTDPVTGVTYVITKGTNAAVMDDILYNPTVKWTQDFPKTWKKSSGLPVVKYEITAISAKSGDKQEKVTSGEITATVTADPATLSGNKITLSAEAILSGYFKDNTGKTPATKENTSNATTKREYTFKDGSDEGNSGGEASEDGEAESEPELTENTTTWNLFYTTEPLKVEVPEGAKHNSSTGYVEGTGKWTTYFGIGPDGTVHYSGAAKDRKKAANAGNSLIVIPLYGTDDSGAEVQTGEFEYQLPVYYQKPSLKLTSTTGTVKVNGGDQTLKTQVTQKKSNGAYEPLNVDAEGAVKLENWKNTQPTFEVDESVITFTATAKGNGNVAVQLPTWSDKISLKYTVKESKKNVLTGSTKQLVFNLNDVTNTAEQEFTLYYNSGDLNSEDPVTVTLPNKWADAKIEGIEAGELSAQTMTLKFADGATPKKGSYSVKFSTKDKGSFTLKVVVSNADLKKNAITLKYQSKIDLTTGQKGVVIPTLKGVNGPIEEVALDDTSAAKFKVEYNEATNQIIVTPVEGQVTVGKNGNVTFKITAGGVPCETTIKNFQVAGKMPAVKVSSVKLPKTKVIAGTATGESNVLCTYKQGGKTFSTTPIEFSVNGGTKTTAEDTVVGEGWWKVDKANVYVQYDAETGRMHVHSIANAKGKAGTVKCEFKFAGQTKVKKANFKVAIDSKN